MSSSFPRVGKPYRVRTPLTKHLNRAKVVTVATVLVHHIDQDGGGGTGSRDKPTAVHGSSNKTSVA